MVNRCTRPNATSYSIYGGRGIKVCDEWGDSFETFCEWAVTNGYEEGLTLDRIDVNGNYEPSNCRFVDRKFQGRNRRITLYVTVWDETKPATEWAEIYGIDPGRIYRRLKQGKSIEEFFSKLKEKKHAEYKNVNL